MWGQDRALWGSGLYCLFGLGVGGGCLKDWLSLGQAEGMLPWEVVT